MYILVINGSPSGDSSITLQTMRYLEKKFPEHIYSVLHAGQQIRKMEQDFSHCIEEVQKADLIVFCYPVYTFLVPAQLYRFVQLLKESTIDLSGKYATQITTSKHFYDMTAHALIEDNCHDLGLHVIHGLSADMEDLLHAQGQKEAEAFFHQVLWSIEQGIFEPDRRITTAQEGKYAHPGEEAKKKGGRYVIVADYDETDEQDAVLRSMITRFQNRASRRTDIVNLRKFPFAGGCLGCFKCAADGTCVYRDGFADLLRDQIQTADAIIYAFRIQDHMMGYRFKLYDDRQFCNGHRTVTMGMPQGYLVDGDLRAEKNLCTVMEARAEVGGNPLCGIASSMNDPDQEIDMLAERLEYALMHHYTQPKNFYGVGGLKIFRDLIWQMQGLMQEDHRFYKKHGFYDFPQKKLPMMLAMYGVGSLMRNKKLQKKMKVSMTQGMLLPYQKIIEKAGRKSRKTQRKPTSKSE